MVRRFPVLTNQVKLKRYVSVIIHEKVQSTEPKIRCIGTPVALIATVHKSGKIFKAEV